MTQYTRDFRIGRAPSLYVAAVLCLCVVNAAPQQSPLQQSPSQQVIGQPSAGQQTTGQQTAPKPSGQQPTVYQTPNGAGGLCTTPAASAANTNTPEDPTFSCPNGNYVHVLHQAERNFSVDFLTYLARNNGGGNVFVSPYSVYEALLLSYFTAAGHTEASLRKLLHLPQDMAKLDVLVAHSCSQKILNSQRAEQLRSANRIYLDKSLEPANCVKQVLHDEIEQISFHDPGVTDTINAWVSKQTNGKIPNLLLPNSVSPDSKLVLTNAAYFKDLWLSQFAPEKTNRSVFFLETQPSKTTFTQMMRHKGSFKVQRSMDLRAHVLELPYTNTNVAMLVLLPPFARNADPAETKNPDALEGIDGVLSRFSAAELTRILDSDVTAKQVEVALPKWSATQSIELVQTLEAMGVGDLFKPTANLTDLTGQPGITFDSVVHQAKIDVDESGTEAAGATAIFSFRSSRPLQPESFICDHPFVYLIVDKTSKTVLFAGIYRFPPSSS